MATARRQKLYLASEGATRALLHHWQPALRANGGRLRGRLHHVGVKAFERLKLTNIRNRDAFSCEWRLCQQALPLVLPHLGRRVLITSNERVFADALREGIHNGALYTLDSEGQIRGLPSCTSPDGALLPGGVVLCLAEPEALATAPMADEGMSAGAAASAVAVACVVCVLSPAGLTVWAPKEEVRGLLELLPAAA